MSESELEESLDNFIPIKTPREGLPDVVETQRGLQKTAELLARGTGPVAIDAERASGFKFSQRAYLIQLRREGSGTFLIDPIEFDNLTVIQEALADTDWILHAASQDLICLAEVGLTPQQKLFDTELAGRLLGLPRVGLGSLVETQLGFSLAKEHSAADWSTRPLPEEWLSYAALDVEFLIELWNVLAEQLHSANKFEWALQEFDHVVRTTVPTPRIDPWRKLSGIHKIKDQRQLAIAKTLWEYRLELAQDLDIASGRILNDSHIVEISLSKDWSSALELSFFRARGIKRNIKTWESAFHIGLKVPDSELPPLKLKTDGPPNPRNWQTRNPELWAILESIRAELSSKAEELNLPVENLVTPESIRRVVWAKPNEVSHIQELLENLNVRQWQREIVEPILHTHLILN